MFRFVEAANNNNNNNINSIQANYEKVLKSWLNVYSQGVVNVKGRQVKQRYLEYLQIAKGVSSDAQTVKDGQYILPTPDFRGTLISPFRHQALALLDPATPGTQNILSRYLLK